MFVFLLVVQIFVSLGIITLVMLQQGKGANMGAGFGAGASGTVFGARGSGSFFTRATAVLAAVFFINCLLIASPLIRDRGAGQQDSIAQQLEQQAKQQQAEEAAGVEEVQEEVSDVPGDVPAAESEAPADVPTAEAPGDVPMTEAPAVPGDVPEIPAAPAGTGDEPG